MKNSTRESTTTNEKTTTTIATSTTTATKVVFFCFHMSGQKSDERIVNDDDNGPLQNISYFR